MRSLVAITALGVCCPVALSADITTVPPSEVGGGASCVIATPKEKTLIDGADSEHTTIRIDGVSIKLKKQSVTRTAITWEGNGVQAIFTITKGALLQSADGAFTPGKGPMGTLVVTYKSATTDVQAREICFGAD